MYTGEKKIPQNKIVGALAEYTTSNIDMRSAVLYICYMSPHVMSSFRVPYGDETTEETIALSTTVSFIFQDSQSLKGYTPPPPPGLLTVPYDIFYPFNIGNTACQSITLQWGNVILSVLVMIGVLAYVE